MTDYPGAVFDAHWREALHPANHRNPDPKSRYHLIVIGAGPAGLISAIAGAGLGAKVALVERHRMGGDCLNVGCVPSKALLEYTRHHANPTFDEAFAWLREVRAQIAPNDSVKRYTEAGVDVFLGNAVFEDHRSVRVGDVVLKGRRIAICTGASPAVPAIPGLREADPLTNETLFDLQMRPPRLAILGAGAIGCEMAQVFARLGTEVHLFEMASRVLPLESEGASAALDRAMRDLGINLHLGKAVSRISREEVFSVHAGSEAIPVDDILVALGRRPNTADLHLDKAGVAVDEQGFVVVDAKLRTRNRRVYAAGDCASRVQFTHHADAQAKVLVQNALFAPTAKVDALIVPHCTYTQPEVASVGRSEAELRKAGTPYQRLEVSFDELDRGHAEPFPSGFAEVLVRPGTDLILGATVVGPDAGEQLMPICLLMSNGLGLKAVDRTIVAYPTRAEYLKRLAGQWKRTQLTPTVSNVFRRWFAFTDG